MDPVSLISIVAGVVAALSATGGLFSVLRKLAGSVKAEKSLKEASASSMKDQLNAELQTRQLQISDLKSASPETMRLLRDRLIALIRASDLSKESADILLSGLEQPSDVGKEQYARRLYAAVAPETTALIDKSPKP
jgi:hypothetical protein